MKKLRRRGSELRCHGNTWHVFSRCEGGISGWVPSTQGASDGVGWWDARTWQYRPVSPAGLLNLNTFPDTCAKHCKSLSGFKLPPTHSLTDPIDYQPFLRMAQSLTGVCYVQSAKNQEWKCHMHLFCSVPSSECFVRKV